MVSHLGEGDLVLAVTTPYTNEKNRGRKRGKVLSKTSGKDSRARISCLWPSTNRLIPSASSASSLQVPTASSQPQLPPGEPGMEGCFYLSQS